MLRTSALIGTVAFAALSVFAIVPTASAAATAPDCASVTDSHFTCLPLAGSSPWTWSVTQVTGENRISYTETTTGALRQTCVDPDEYSVYYSYVSGGSTITSATTTFACQGNGTL
jgi:hypothetical protein